MKTTTVLGQSELISLANRAMQTAWFWYANGNERIADEQASLAEWYFASARCRNFGSFTTVQAVR